MIDTKPKTQNTSQAGFTYVELLTVIVMIGLLTAGVSLNFIRHRSFQTLDTTLTQQISKIREIQSFILAGKVISGTDSADAYELTFDDEGESYQIHYEIGGVKTLYQTVNFAPGVRLEQITLGGNIIAQAVVRFESPYANVLINGNPDEQLQIRLQYLETLPTQQMAIDGISGRIEKE